MMQDYIITDPIFYAFVIPGVIALGLAKGGFFGAGQMATPMLALTMPPLEAAAIILPIIIVQDAGAIWAYRRDWSRKIVAIMVPGMIAGVCVAWAFAAYISDAAVRVFIGSVSIAFCLYSWISAALYKGEPMAREPGRVAGLFWAAMSGFTSTIAQSGGPPFQMYVLRLRLAKMTFVGTTAVFFGILNWVKVVPYMALGQFSAKGLTTSAALIPLAIVANIFGIWLVQRTPERLFYKLTLILMFVLAFALVHTGLKDLLPNYPLR